MVWSAPHSVIRLSQALSRVGCLSEVYRSEDSRQNLGQDNGLRALCARRHRQGWCHLLRTWTTLSCPHTCTEPLVQFH